MLSEDGNPCSAPLSPDLTKTELLARLTERIEIWESPEDLTRLYPSTVRSTFHGFDSSEVIALNEFLAQDDHGPGYPPERFNEYELDDFCVYCAPTHRHLQGQFDYLSITMSELSPKENYSSGAAQPYWLVNGVLRYKGITRQIVAAEVVAVEMGELEHLEAHSAEDSIWIMTVESQKKNYWYRLKTPSNAYLSYWTTFTWLADFAKFFIDYLYICRETGTDVHLSHFRYQFWVWLHGLRGHKLQKWHAQCANQTDFRQHVLSHALFLYQQACSLGQQGPRMSHPIWAEIGAVTGTQVSQATAKAKKTLVTRNVAASFARFLAWQKHDLLEITQLSLQAEAYRTSKMQQWEFPVKLRNNNDTFITMSNGSQVSKAAMILEEAGEENQPVFVSNPQDLVGQIVVMRTMGDAYGQWEFSYAWVKKATSELLRVIWLALPADTICGSPGDPKVFYPVGNELFFSDRCSCETVSIQEVVRIVSASVCERRPADNAELFVQSLYREEEETITTLAASELMSCQCLTHDQNWTANRQQQHVPKERGDRPRLRGLSLFSGCGLFDHAFTSKGSSEIVYAIEHCEIATRSYKANDVLNTTHMTIGSVEDVFEDFALGRQPMPDIDFIIGGFPCPYYSSMNCFRDSQKGHKDGSLLANMLSWIELFLPPYVLMENVPNMDRLRPNACRQAICHLVALGYQVRKSIHTDASLGGASIRERLFIVAAAPGVLLPDDLVDTHGPAGSGLRKIRTVAETIGGLEAITNDSCINVKDTSHVPLHRLGLDFARHVSYRSLVRQIPTEPKCMSLAQTYYDKGLLPHQRRFFEQGLHAEKQARTSRTLKRVDPDTPFRTVCTIISPLDARVGGHIIHPTQHRTLSLKEGGRRAMGVPDSFLLAGSVEEQYKQCGNAVPWAMGAAWGRNFSRAWFASLDRRSPAQNEALPVEVMKPEQSNEDVSCDVAPSGMEKGDEHVATQKQKHNETGSGVPTSLELRNHHDLVGYHGGSDNDSDSSVEILEVRPVKRPFVPSVIEIEDEVVAMPNQTQKQSGVLEVPDHHDDEDDGSDSDNHSDGSIEIIHVRPAKRPRAF
ncbi:hypothetical protein A1O1_03175 [Capronia coronata CBS 617.96]|uniref:DNA (cytosine-5-)-methyltransferase n=1 Tax=Capronia coronata CBS 617.96 TaxID=1182541 RepID=W9YPB1_9EURO|nr:uncharacterized protein A1O1_03175 [Capronia coronata CBS 617.96]EXJ94777.1 hypothetical protein A1O1_03175 [Capronia coronata CBS 617.96]